MRYFEPFKSPRHLIKILINFYKSPGISGFLVYFLLLLSSSYYNPDLSCTFLYPPVYECMYVFLGGTYTLLLGGTVGRHFGHAGSRSAGTA